MIEFFFKAVSFPGNHLFLVLMIVFLTSALLFRFAGKTSAVLINLSLSASLISLILKALFKTSRPSAEFADPFFFSANQYGFPSGHTALYTAFLGFLVYVLYKSVVNKTLAHIVSIGCLILIVSVGASRIYLGAHTLADVLGGYLVGGIVLLTLVKLDIFLERKSDKVQQKHSKR